ncbi:MAG TPA: Fe-S cluster assembly ATPase SufC [Bacteroidetes bacterium]|nr:Fe-S cluster assembly ATPase SufC [Bacteroidota bacterium]
MKLLEIKDLHVNIGDKEIIKGLDLTINYGEVHAIMGPNGTGKSTLAAALVGKPDYEITKGKVIYKGQDLTEMEPEERALMGIFLAFQYPVEIPGVSMINFMKTIIDARRKHQGLEPLSPADFLKLVKESGKLVGISDRMKGRAVNEGFSGGEKKKNEIFQMAMLKPELAILDELDSGLDIDSLRIVAEAINKLRSDKNSFLIITHYQRLLDYIEPDFVHIMNDGKIVKSGNKSLAIALEEKGYDGVMSLN